MAVPRHGRRPRDQSPTLVVLRTILVTCLLLSLLIIFQSTNLQFARDTSSSSILELDLPQLWNRPEQQQQQQWNDEDEITTTTTSTAGSSSESTTESASALFTAHSPPVTVLRRLPTLDELTQIPSNYSCPEHMQVFPNLVVPHETHATKRKIPKVVHVTAKTRCVTPTMKEHLLQWNLEGHSLYFHDDAAVYKLLDYALGNGNDNDNDNDNGNHQPPPILKDLRDTILCASSGACLSDFWRYILLFYYGGIYTDLDNSPGANYTTEYITPETDSFFFVEQLGTMSQFYMASARHHPIWLHCLYAASHKGWSLYNTTNVMRNNPAKRTGPGAVKKGMILFLQTGNVTSDGYVPQGMYHGGVGPKLQSQLLWLNDDNNNNYHDDDAYPNALEMENRSVTVYGKKEDNGLYIDRMGLAPNLKSEAWKDMNMTHYFSKTRTLPNKISCMQHVDRMKRETTRKGSFYYQKTKLQDLLPKYEFRESESHFFDTNTNEKLIPWPNEKIQAILKEYQ